MSSTQQPANTTGSSYSYYVLFMLFIVCLFNIMDRKLISVLMPDIKAEFMLTDSQLGLLTGLAFALFYLLAGIPIARWADTGNRRNIITMGLIFWSIMTALSGFAMSFVHLLLLRIGVAVGEAAAGPPAQSLISDYFPRHRRATALSIYGLGGSLGAIVGLWLGGILVTEYGWRTAFWALGAPGVAVALVFYWSVREPVRGAMDIAPQQNEQSSFKEVCWHLLSMPSFRYLMLGASFSMFAHFGVNMWDVTFVRRIHGVTAEEAGRALGLVHMLAIPSGLLGAILADKFGKKDIRFYMWLPAASALFGAPFTLAFILSNDFQSAIIFAAVGMAVGSWWMGASLATVQNLAAPHMRALAAAIFTLTYNMVGMGLGPSVVGWITDAFAATHGDEAIRFAFLFSIIPLTLSGLCFLMVAKHLKQDIQE